MEDEQKMLISVTFIVIVGILLFTGVIAGSMYYYHELEVDNFQVTIEELNNEQKCLHICGFQYPDSVYFDQYKFCVEKCDRISERESRCNL